MSSGSDEEVYTNSETNSEINSEEEHDQEEDVILDLPALEATMKKEISEIQSIVEVSEGVARILLQQHKWIKESITDKLYESPDRISFLIDSNIIPKQSIPIEIEGGECEICCDDTSQLVGLDCNHRSCKMCWKMYLTEKIKEGQSEIECMDSKCHLLVEDGKIDELLSSNDPTVIQSYHRLIRNKYVHSNIFLTWCPGVDCGKAVKSADCEAHLVTCTCGSEYCFSCNNEWHEPVNCNHMRLWMKKCGENSETTNWILKNTKDCPKCSAQIEKNGGCNYIKCTNSACGYQFCWVCMKAWSVHAQAWYSCNSFDQAADRDRKTNRSNPLNRYVFYYNRYKSHEDSLRLEAKLIQKVDIKMEMMQKRGMGFNDVQFLRKAVDILSVCRRTMMFTYVFAYFLDKNNHSLIFQENQKDLEMATEKLSELLENNFDDRDLKTLKQKVLDKCRYVEQRRKLLLNHCSEGNDNDQWEFLE